MVYSSHLVVIMEIIHFLMQVDPRAMSISCPQPSAALEPAIDRKAN